MLYSCCQQFDFKFITCVFFNTQAELVSSVNRFLFSFFLQCNEENNVSQAYDEEKTARIAFTKL